MGASYHSWDLATMPVRLTTVITLSVVAALKPGDVAHDSKLIGFGARRQKHAVSYFVKLRHAGKQRWITVGRHNQPTPDGDTWRPDTARVRAKQLIGNPLLADPLPSSPDSTFATVVEQFMTEHAPKLRPRTLVEYRRMVDQYLVPILGQHPVAAVTRGHVISAHATWSGTPRSGNFALTVLSKFMSWAEDHGYRHDGTNPVRRVERYKENKRERFLTPEELARLGAALDHVEAQHLTSPYIVAAIRLLIFTGCRLSEILTLEWSHVDITRKMLFLDDSKTGKKSVTLNDAAMDVLANIPRFQNNPYVIVGHRYGSHLVNLHAPWNMIRIMAELPGVRLHDLRHTFASVAVATGGSLPVLGRQLGHSQSRTTQRYAHLSDDPVRQLTQTTGERLAQSLRSKPE